MTLAEGEGERECAGCGKSEIDSDMVLHDIFLPPLIPRQLLCKPCLNILLDSERKKKGM